MTGVACTVCAGTSPGGVVVGPGTGDNMAAALGLGLSSTVLGRNPLLDGFGLIAFASLFPIMSVMAYAQLSEWSARRSKPTQPT